MHWYTALLATAPGAASNEGWGRMFPSQAQELDASCTLAEADLQHRVTAKALLPCHWLSDRPHTQANEQHWLLLSAMWAS